MKLDRQNIKKIDKNITHFDEKSPLSPTDCLAEVWELTKEVFSLSQKYDVESRLQRNVVHFFRGRS